MNDPLPSFAASFTAIALVDVALVLATVVIAAVFVGLIG